MVDGTEFRILGPLEIASGGKAIELRGAAQRALLTRLLLDVNRVVSAEQLIADLWVSPPESGVAALHQRMVKLRQALAPGRSAEALIATHDPGYVVRLREGQLDLHRFESLVAAGEKALAAADATRASTALREALELWRGKPLAEFRDAPFAAPATARLEELRLMALETRVEADLLLGRHLQVIGELEALVGDEPFREGLHAKLMLALYRAGRQAGALEAYQRLRKTLVEELGVEPTQAVQDLERAILNHDSALDLPKAPPTRSASEAPPAAPPTGALDPRVPEPGQQPGGAPRSRRAAHPASTARDHSHYSRGVGERARPSDAGPRRAASETTLQRGGCQGRLLQVRIDRLRPRATDRRPGSRSLAH